MSRKMEISFNNDNNSAKALNYYDDLYALVNRNNYTVDNHRKPKVTVYSFKFFYNYGFIGFHNAFETINVYFKNGKLSYVSSKNCLRKDCLINSNGTRKHISPIIMYNPVRNSNNNFYTSLDDTKIDMTHAFHMVMGFFNSCEFKQSSWYANSKRNQLVAEKAKIKAQCHSKLQSINNELKRL